MHMNPIRDDRVCDTGAMDTQHRNEAIAPANARTLARARDLLAAGRLVAMPTDTVYGLAADATSDAAVAALYDAKGRPRDNPLIALAGTLEAAEKLVLFDADARCLARRFWPGPLSLVLPRRPDCPVSQLASAGLATLAVRVPGHSVVLDILGATGFPLVVPSANLSGAASPRRAEQVVGQLGDRIPLVIDGGRSPAGLESTLVRCAAGGPVILREGAIGAVDIKAALGHSKR